MIACSALVLLLSANAAAAQQPAPADTMQYRHFVGSTVFLLGNFLENSPQFAQLNYGYRLSPKSTVSIEAITWRYTAPLGIPWGPDYDQEENNYPGQVRSIGIGVAYQRFLWRGLYAGAHALPLLQQYSDESGARLSTGFQLFTTLRTGYQVNLFGGRWFIEPSIAATAWPINTAVPASFAALDRKWNNYFLFEPGLHFGRRF